MNPTTIRAIERNPENQPALPLDFVPNPLRAAGLADAHSRPLVGVRTGDKVRSWRTSPAVAWAGSSGDVGPRARRCGVWRSRGVGVCGVAVPEGGAGGQLEHGEGVNTCARSTLTRSG